MSNFSRVDDMARIRAIADRATTNRDVRASITRLEDEKADALKTGLRILMSGDYEARDKWITHYKSLCRRINEDRAELENAA